MKKNITLRTDQDDEIIVKIPNVGLGTMRTTTSYIVLLASIEGSRSDQIRILTSALEELGIKPEELAHQQKHPDVSFSNVLDEWTMRAVEIRNSPPAECNHKWVDDAGGGYTYFQYCPKCFVARRKTSPKGKDIAKDI